MGMSNKSLQKKRAKKAQKRKQKKALSNMMPSTKSWQWPVYECWMRSDLWESGIGQVVVSRRFNDQYMVMGFYLLDVWCLGVKDCFIRKGGMEDYAHFLQQIENQGCDLKHITPAYAHALITQMVDYANNLHLAPHPDYARASRLLRGLPVDETLRFSFGKDGQPFYMQGPHESLSQAQSIVNTLHDAVGSDNFHYAVSTGAFTNMPEHAPLAQE